MTNYEVREIITGFYNSHHNLNEYWNKGYAEYQLSSSDWGLTSTKCVKDACTSNEFGDCEQCFGFALFMAYLIFGTRLDYGMITNAADGDVLTGGWRIYKNQSSINSLTLEPGDIIRDMYSYIDSETGETKCSKHAAIVREVTGNTFRVAECWGSDPYGCQLAWEYFNGNSSNANISTVLSRAVFVLKAPKTGKTCKISNYGNGKYLNVVGTALSNNQSVTTRASNGTDGQKWYINGYNNGEYIRSAVDADYVLSTGSSNACVLSDNDSSQSNMVDIVIVGENSTGKICIIRKSNDSFICLTSDGTRAYWDTYSSGNNLHKWVFAEM